MRPVEGEDAPFPLPCVDVGRRVDVGLGVEVPEGHAEAREDHVHGAAREVLVDGELRREVEACASRQKRHVGAAGEVGAEEVRIDDVAGAEGDAGADATERVGDVEVGRARVDAQIGDAEERPPGSALGGERPGLEAQREPRVGGVRSVPRKGADGPVGPRPAAHPHVAERHVEAFDAEVGVSRGALLGAPCLEVDGSEPSAPADDERRRLRDELRQGLDVGKLALGDVDEEMQVREERGEVERATVARDGDARDVEEDAGRRRIAGARASRDVHAPELRVEVEPGTGGRGRHDALCRERPEESILAMAAHGVRQRDVDEGALLEPSAPELDDEAMQVGFAGDPHTRRPVDGEAAHVRAPGREVARHVERAEHVHPVGGPCVEGVLHDPEDRARELVGDRRGPREDGPSRTSICTGPMSTRRCGWKSNRPAIRMLPSKRAWSIQISRTSSATMSSRWACHSRYFASSQ